MAYRFTNTDKWSDAWFSELKPIEKLLFNYLCDNCDIAGFVEVTIKKWSYDIGSDSRSIEGALKGLQRGLTYSVLGDCIFINNFLKHQKNLPLNENNKAHKGILRRFELYSHKFDIQDVDEFIQGASKGLSSPIGIGNGKGSGIGEGKKPPETTNPMPTFEEFKTYALEKEPLIDLKDLEFKYEAWKVNGWKTGKDKKIKNWKSTLLQTIPHIKKNTVPTSLNTKFMSEQEIDDRNPNRLKL
jgi:hypothetical protein